MVLGELVWCRKKNLRDSGWGIICDQHTIYLDDGNSMMISWSVFIEGTTEIYDTCELVTFQYYNRHLYHERSYVGAQSG